jgi:hypothetical protein
VADFLGRDSSVLDYLFGSELPVQLRFIIAFGVVLSLIALTFVGLRRFAGRKLPLANAGRARQPRLGVLDAFAIDARRRLVLIRRDNVEHLIMIGGPNDVLIESEIVRAPAQAGLPAQQQRTQTTQNGQNGQNQRPVENGRAAAPPVPVQAPQTPQRERAVEAPIASVAIPPAPEPDIRPAPFRSTMPRATPPLQAPLQAPHQANVPPAIQPNLPPRAPAPARPVRAVEPALPVTPPLPPVRDEPVAAKPKADVDPLYADIEKKLSEALARPQGATPPPARPASQPAPVRREPAVEAPAPTAKEPKSHLDALEEEMASLLGRERPS